MTNDYDDTIPVLDTELADRLSDLDEDLASQRATALRAGLDDYDLDEEDLDVLEMATDDPDAIVYLPALPVLAIVGRPNVGKSALVNRILGRREAVVEDTPASPATGSPTRASGTNAASPSSTPAAGSRTPRASTPPSPPRPRSPSTSPTPSCSSSTPTSAPPPPTSTWCGCCAPAKKPVILVANKVDDVRQEPEAAGLWSLGLGQPWPVSALHGRGVADLLDHVLTVLPEVSAVAKEEVGGPRRVAILGRPNVGKSSLLNKAAGRSGSSSTSSPAPPATRSTSRSSSAARSGASSTPPASVAACTWPRAPTSTRRCARAPRSRRPRSPW